MRGRRITEDIEREDLSKDEDMYGYAMIDLQG